MEISDFRSPLEHKKFIYSNPPESVVSGESIAEPPHVRLLASMKESRDRKFLFQFSSQRKLFFFSNNYFYVVSVSRYQWRNVNSQFLLSFGHNWEPLSRHLFSLCENHQVFLQESWLDFTAFPRIRVVLIFSRIPPAMNMQGYCHTI